MPSINTHSAGAPARPPGPNHRSHARAAFTAVEVCVAIAVIVVLLAILLPLSGNGRRCGARQLKDSTQIRGVMQAMVIFAQNNGGKYPLPSKLDAESSTLGGDPAAKDTTGNVLSVLIWNGNISAELCVSPAESNTDQVRVCADYQFSNPSAAAQPAGALWDPAFRGTPIDAPIGARSVAAPGNNSYAQIVNIGARRALWTETFSATEAVFGNRGPVYADDDAAPTPKGGRWQLTHGPLGDGSNTLLIHGGRTTWEGNIAYNDGHVSFETGPTPEGVLYARGTDPDTRDTPDNLFVNESDETGGDAPGLFDKGRNAYLRPIARFDSPGKPVLWRD